MRGIKHVILAWFIGALWHRKDVQASPLAAQSDAKIAIQCVREIRDFCLMAQYRSHTLQTTWYVTQYLPQLHECMHVFSEFQPSEADREEAAKAAKDLAEGHTQQATTH